MILDVWTAFLWIFVNIHFWTHPNGRLRDPSLSLLVAGDIRLSWEGASQRLINPLTSPHHVTLHICKWVYIHEIWKWRLQIISNQTSDWVGRVPATSTQLNSAHLGHCICNYVNLYMGYIIYYIRPGLINPSWTLSTHKYANKTNTSINIALAQRTLDLSTFTDTQ